MRSLHLTIASIALGASASAQTLNIDVGLGSGTPSNTYGAAAGVTGEWDVMDGVNGTYGPFVDVTGVLTNVTITLSAGADFMFDNINTSGDDEALMDDLSDAFANGGPPMAATIAGLADGSYDIYTYAFAPDDATFSTMVDITLSGSGPQIVGGAWPGAHLLGTTYVLHTGIVVAGGNDVIVDFAQDPANPSPGSLNGFQIVGSGIGSIGTNYCTPAIPNSTGNPADISATGSVVASQNNVTLIVSNIPPMQFGYFLAGQTQGMFMPMSSSGFICVAGNIGRYNAVANIITGPSGSIQLDLGAIPVNPPQAVQSGETWNFQCWYRDIGNTNNFSDALQVDFL